MVAFANLAIAFVAVRNDRFRPDAFTGCTALLAGTLATARLMNVPGRDLAGLAGFATVLIGFQVGGVCVGVDKSLDVQGMSALTFLPPMAAGGRAPRRPPRLASRRPRTAHGVNDPANPISRCRTRAGRRGGGRGRPW